MGSGYARVCDENGVWSETMEGECSCPAEVVHHSDGNVYLMEEVVAVRNKQTNKQMLRTSTDQWQLLTPIHLRLRAP